MKIELELRRTAYIVVKLLVVMSNSSVGRKVDILSQ